MDMAEIRYVIIFPEQLHIVHYIYGDFHLDFVTDDL